MATTIQLSAERRSATGKGAARQLRLHGRIPAVIYGHGREPEALTLAEADFDRALASGAHETTIFDLSVDGANVTALVREVQRHPFRAKVLHVDFLEIHAGQMLTLAVPIKLVGTPDGVRNQGGVLDQVMREIEIRVLPKDIPDHIEVDVTALRVHDSIHVSDLNIPEAEILEEDGATICTVSAPRVEEEPTAAVEAEETAEPEVIGRKAEEGEDEDEAGDEE